MPTLSLTGSVGRDGANDPDDVRLVQHLINCYLGSLSTPASIDDDGVAGSPTIEAIEQFQKDVVGLASPDGRVDADGPSFHALLVAASTADAGSAGQAGSDTAVATIAWGAKVSLGFKQKVVVISGRLGADPSHLMAAMAFESGQTFSPSIRNRLSGATGLIQFMPATAARLGTSTDALAAMPPENQLDYVERYFQPYSGRVPTIEDLYMAILWPVAIGKALDYVLFRTPSQAYLQNRGLDANHDGIVTKHDGASPVIAMLSKGLGLSG